MKEFQRQKEEYWRYIEKLDAASMQLEEQALCTERFFLKKEINLFFNT